MRASRGSAGLMGLCYIHMELGRSGKGMGIVRDNHKTLLLTTKCLPDQRLSPQVASHCYTCARTSIHMHTSIYIWRCPHIRTHAHTHGTHECDFLGTYSHMSTCSQMTCACVCARTCAPRSTLSGSPLGLTRRWLPGCWTVPTHAQMLTHANILSDAHTPMGMHIYVGKPLL